MTVSIIKNNIITIIIGVVLTVFYFLAVIHSQRIQSNHVIALNNWVTDLDKNDAQLDAHKISQTQWLKNRHIIFNTYLKAEIDNQ